MTTDLEYDWRAKTRVILYDEYNRVVETLYFEKGTMPKISKLYTQFPTAQRMDIR